MTSNAIGSYKVVLLGEGRVGKTSILLRYAENSYLEGRIPTLQASYVDKHVIIDEREEIKHSSSVLRMPTHHKSREAHLSIWDTAGQERYHSLGPIYYRNAHGAILVYDITDRSSFERVQKWVKELRKMVGDRNRICLIIVGNKSDLSRQRSVDAEEAACYAKSVDAAYLEASAKTGSGVEVMLDTLKPSSRSLDSSDLLRKATNRSPKVSEKEKYIERGGGCC